MDTSLIHIGVLPENTSEVLVYLGNDTMPADFDQLAYAEAILRGWAIGAGSSIIFHVTTHNSSLSIKNGEQIDFNPVASAAKLKKQVAENTNAGRLVFIQAGSNDRPITQEMYEEIMAYLSDVSYDRIFVCGHVFKFICSVIQ